MHEGDVAPRHGELGAALGGFFIVAQAAFQVAAFQADAAELHVGFGQVGGVAHGVEQGLFGAHEVTLAQQGQAQVVVMVGALLVGRDLHLEVGNIFVDIVVTLFHRMWPSFFSRS